MKKFYNPALFEKKIYSFWENNDSFKTNNDPNKDNFCILLPPPNITGNLHMGHAFQQTIMDIIIRYHRMQKKNTLWQGGTDHAGIATQLVVLNQLNNISESSIKDNGVNIKQVIFKWKDSLEKKIFQQMRSLGLSINWERFRFTLDEKYSLAVNESFIRLYQDNLIYKTNRLVNWDPILCTAISDLEVRKKDVKGKIWYIKYYFAPPYGTYTNRGDFLTIATTRPETILGDVAVAVNPYDSRNIQFVGRSVFVPLINRTIPVISETCININKNSGCVKITPAHDFNDYDIALRHSLPFINILDHKGRIKFCANLVYQTNDNNIEDYIIIDSELENLNRFSAREKMLNKLFKSGFIIKEKNHIVLNYYNMRNNTLIEPLLTPQWYLKTSLLAEEAIKVVEDRKIIFLPQKYENIYFAWMKNIKDWCISRQIMWGHPIPIWYDNEKNIYLGNNPQQIILKYGLKSETILTKDPYVLDTWFSSALWSLASLDWPINNKYLKRFHPTEVLVTGYDIIFFWVARMIMLSLYLLKDEKLNKKIPFKKIYVTGLICDELGKKMSKSQGNVVDPMDLINGIPLQELIYKRTKDLLINNNKLISSIISRTKKQFPKGITAYGADSLRLALTSLATLTNREIKWNTGKIEEARNFCNKLWNLSRYILKITSSLVVSAEHEPSIFDKWIISEYNIFISKFIKDLNNYRFDLAIQKMRRFVWKEFCDWYIEFTKPIFKDYIHKDKIKLVTNIKQTLIVILESLLRLIHPIIPYITEEIWHKIITNEGEKTIMLSYYPIVNRELINIKYRIPINYLKEILICIRSFRQQFTLVANINMELMIYFNCCKQGWQKDKESFFIIKDLLKRLASIKRIVILDHEFKKDYNCYIVKIVKRTHIYFRIELSPIQIKNELNRIDRLLNNTQKEISLLIDKLNNKVFLKKAPLNIIDNIREKLIIKQTQKEELRLQSNLLKKP